MHLDGHVHRHNFKNASLRSVQNGTNKGTTFTNRSLLIPEAKAARRVKSHSYGLGGVGTIVGTIIGSRIAGHAGAAIYDRKRPVKTSRQASKRGGRFFAAGLATGVASGGMALHYLNRGNLHRSIQASMYGVVPTQAAFGAASYYHGRAKSIQTLQKRKRARKKR